MLDGEQAKEAPMPGNAGNQLVRIGPSINGRRSEMRHESAGIFIHTFDLQQQIQDALKAT
jgi:hypothetical protein